MTTSPGDARELWLVVADDDIRSVTGFEHAGQNTRHPSSADRRVDLDRQAVPRELVADVRGPESVDAGQGIEREVQTIARYAESSAAAHDTEAESLALTLRPSDSQSLSTRGAGTPACG